MKLEIINDREHYCNDKHYNLGCILYTGLGDTVVKDHTMAYDQFYEGRENILCKYNMVCMIYNGEGTAQGSDYPITVFKELSHAPSKLALAMINFEDNDARDPKPFLELVESGLLPDRQHQFCLFYLANCQIYQNIQDKALSYLLQIDNVNMTEVNYLIGELYYQSETVPDKGKCNIYFKKAADNNHQLAKWRMNRKCLPDEDVISQVKQKADVMVSVWMRICADLKRCEGTFDGFMEAAEYYRLLELSQMSDGCLGAAFNLGARDLENLERMISFGYLPARVKYCEMLYDTEQYTEKLEHHLIICNGQRDVMSCYRLARVYQSWGRNSDAIENYQCFASRSDDPLDAKLRIKQIQESKKNAPVEETPSEASCDDFIEVEFSPDSENESNTVLLKKIENILSSSPDLVGQAVIKMIKRKKPRVGFYSSYVSVLMRLGVSDEVLDSIIIEGARKGNGYCLRILGKRWLRQHLEEQEQEMEEVD